MRYSKLFAKTSKTAPRDAQAISHRLLSRGGFIEKSVAGHYYFLPLGWQVHQKIIAIIREEMDKTGAQEMLAPTLHPLALWQETNRDQSVSFELMTVTNRQGAKFALGGTAEEMFVDLVRGMNLSYRDLPFNLYQFSTKFRDELRPRGGLLRVREFIMKDAYSFDTDAKEFKKEYAAMKQAYQAIFKRLDLTTLVVEADSGYIGGDYCHEFVCPAEVGEDTIFTCSHCSYQANQEKANFIREEKNPQEEVKEFKMIDQPEWVKTMDDNVKHYGQPRWRYLKNVVYKDEDDRLIIASLRGDQVVSETKLKTLLGVAQLTPAKEEDLEKIGTQSGWVHSWGEKGVTYVGDTGLTKVKNFIGGFKQKNKDSYNVNYGRDFEYELLGDIAQAKKGDVCPQCRKGQLQEKSGIEVGHIFQLGHHYTNLMAGAVFADENGQEKPFYMGCYGLGVGRTMAAIVETHHDADGIIWPAAVTPYHFYLIALGREQKAEKIYRRLQEAGFSVLYDDRHLGAGEKFADADLLGIPLRLVISEKTDDKIELKQRDQKKTTLLSFSKLVEQAKKFYKI